LIAIYGATIYQADRLKTDVVLLMEGGIIQAMGSPDQVSIPPDAHSIDAAGQILAPGFIDLQLNGGFGFDFTADPSAIWEVAAKLPRFGVTAFLPTIITCRLETIRMAQGVLRNGPPVGFRGAVPLGLHIEGPYLNPARKGAHNGAYLRTPDLTEIVNWSPENHVLLVTLAPELPGGLKMIRELYARNVVVSAGHSLASYEEMRAAIAAGVRSGTHLFNAMPPLEHRKPGMIGALLEAEEVILGLIPDGIHVHPALIRLIWRAHARRIAAVTDAMAAMGMPAGSYRLGDYAVTADSGSARLTDGTLAGSTVSMDGALQSLSRILGPEASIGDLLAAFSATPARLLNLPTHGRLEPGSAADLILLSPELTIEQVWVAGQETYSRRVV